MELRVFVDQSRAGDVDAFTRLVRRYQDMAFACAFSLLRDFQLAEDATQEAFLAVYANLHALREPDAFPGWLRGIVRHQCHRISRKRRFDSAPLEGRLTGAIVPGPERQVEEQETRQRVLDAVYALPQPQREVIALYYLQDYSQQEIAAFLEVPVTTVNSRLHAARTRLKRRMLPMVKETLRENGLPNDFAERVGQIVRVQGPVVDARFAPEELPAIFSVLTIEGSTGRPEVTVNRRALLCLHSSNRRQKLPNGKILPPISLKWSRRWRQRATYRRSTCLRSIRMTPNWPPGFRIWMR